MHEALKALVYEALATGADTRRDSLLVQKYKYSFLVVGGASDLHPASPLFVPI